MAVESAKQDIKGSYGEGFVIMGTDRVEVGPDGKKVTAYTNEGQETVDIESYAVLRICKVFSGDKY